VRGSVGYPSAFDGYTIYPSYTAAIIYWFNMLRNGYVNRGLSTVYTIARPYVGTSSYPLWAGKVIALMYNYRGIAPPPPVSVPQPKPTINPAIVAANNARSRMLAAWLQYLSARNYSMPAYVSGRIQEKLASSAGTQPLNMTPALPRAAELSIVLFGLLTALAIALYSLKMPVVRVQQAQVSMAETPKRGQAIACGQGEQVAPCPQAMACPRPAFSPRLSRPAAPLCSLADSTKLKWRLAFPCRFLRCRAGLHR
jgi:hypothetical protein